MPEHLILCGGAHNNDDAALKLALGGPHKNINFETERIPARLCAPLTPRLADLLEIATFVHCADQAIGRGGSVQSGMGAAWRRDLRIVIPVRDPEHWSRAEITERLCRTVGFLSDDNYRFEFEQLAESVATQAYLPFDETKEAFNPRMVIPFSGGLDSLAGAIDELSSRQGRVVLVSHRSASKVLSYQKKLIKKLSTRFPNKLLHIPVLVTMTASLPVKDYNQRSRSFLYASIAAATAHTLGIKQIRFFENGVVSINLPLSEQVVGSRATRTTHPRVIKDFADLFSAALEKEIIVENPYIWRTKREVVEVITGRNLGSLIDDSVSCTRVHEMTQQHTHCGRCSQCIDRRFAVLAAGADEHDSPDKYACDLLTGAREDGLDRTMAESYVRAAVQIGKMNDVAFFSRYSGNVASLLDCFPTQSADEIGHAAYDLLKRHAVNVTQVLSSAVVRHSCDLIEHRLPASCVTVMSVSQGISQADMPGLAGFADEQHAVELQRTDDDPMPLQLALDERTPDVLIRGVMRITGADSRLVRVLEATHREDRLAGRAPENYRFVAPETLADNLEYDDVVAVRQRVSTCRAAAKEMFREVHGFQLPQNALIETGRPHGYRLNPHVRFIAIAELAEVSAPSHRTKKSVTKRSEPV